MSDGITQHRGLMTEKTFDEAVRLLESRVNLEQLQSFEPDKMTGRLDMMRQILADFGNPEQQYRTIHVAGTKGKGSVCAFLESVFLAEGKRVGTFTSPHLYFFTERIKIDGKPCSDDDFTHLMFSVCDKIEPAKLAELTYFELLALLAFVYFAEQKVDAAVIEVGLGGRLDATNVCHPDVTVITSISYDHMMQLGPSLAEIAVEKSGIIKPHVPLVTAVIHPEAQKVIHSQAKANNATAFFLGESFFVKPSLSCKATRFAFHFQSSLPDFPFDYEIDNIELAMPGAHQTRNASLAVTARLLLNRYFGEPDNQTIRKGLANAVVPLRVEVIRPATDDKPTIILDGAHNRSSVRAFVKTVTERFPNRRMFLIFGVSMGKDVEGMIAELSGRFYHIYLTQYSNNARAFPAVGLQRIFSLDPAVLPPIDDEYGEVPNLMEASVILNPSIFDAVLTCPTDFETEPDNLEVVADCREALKKCLQNATPQDLVCVTGSLYLAAELRKELQVT